jgi:hypothetical protein
MRRWSREWFGGFKSGSVVSFSYYVSVLRELKVVLVMF